MKEEVLNQTIEAKKRTQIMLDALPLSCTLADRNNRIIDCNKEAVKFFGVSKKQILIDTFFDFMPEFQPDGQRSLEKAYDQITQTFDKGYNRFEWLHLIGGKIVPCEVTLVRVKYKDTYIIAGYTHDLRELKAATAKMREADERTQTMLDATPLVSNFWNRNVELIDCNKEALRLFGLSCKQEYLDRFYELSPEYQPGGKSSAEAARKYVVKAFEEGKCRFEWLHQKLNGELIPCEVTLVRVKYRNDYTVMGYTHDLRELKAATAKMREADERTQIIFDTAPNACFMFDENFNIFDCNQETVKMFGLPNKQIFPERYFDLSPEHQPCGRKSREMIIAQYKKTFKDGYNRYEWMHQTLGGEPMPCEVTQVRVKYKDGYAVTAYIRDLREQKALLYKVHNESEKNKTMAHWYESLLDAIPFFISVQDINEKWTFINAAAETFLGKKRDEIIGMPCKNWGLSICNTPNCAIDCAKRGLSRTRFTYNDESYQVDTKLLKDLNDKTSGYVEVIQDITKMESMLKQQAEMEAAGKAKSYFLSTMSHEMRAPMNAILGMAVIGKNEDSTQRKNYALNRIEDASRHLLNVINAVLDMSKIEANKLELSQSVFELKYSIQKAVSFVQFNLDEKQICFSMKIDDKTPSFLIGDDHRLTQVLTNLLSNAVKFSHREGKIELNVSFLGEEDGLCKLRFEVADNGIGLSEEQQERIFNPYEQAESGMSGKFGGTGLGLVITKRIIELMDGNIWVESGGLGEGAKFIFTANLYRDDQGLHRLQLYSGADKKEKISARDIYEKFRGKKLLVVDDIDINREIIISLLCGTGLIIDAAKNGNEAYDMVMADPNKYDLIFMDMKMPVMDGLEATRRIRTLTAARSRRLPIIAVTANVLQDDIENCYLAGMDDHIGEPVEVEVILEKLYEYLS